MTLLTQADRANENRKITTPMAYCQSQDHQLFILNEAEQTVISNAIPPLSAPVGRQALAVGAWVSAVHEVFVYPRFQHPLGIAV